MTVSKEEHFRLIIENSKQHFSALSAGLSEFRADVTHRLENISRDIQTHDRQIYKLEHDVKNLQLANEFRSEKAATNVTNLEGRIDALTATITNEKRALRTLFIKVFFGFVSFTTALLTFLAYMFENYIDIKLE